MKVFLSLKNKICDMIDSDNSRAVEVREELSASVDELPSTGYQKRELYQGGGRDHNQVA